MFTLSSMQANAPRTQANHDICTRMLLHKSVACVLVPVLGTGSPFMHMYYLYCSASQATPRYHPVEKHSANHLNVFAGLMPDFVRMRGNGPESRAKI